MTKKILIVDDDKHLRTLLESRLKSWGYNVILADDGNKGLELARKKAPDLILLDIVMPNLDGYQFSLLMKSDERLKKIPVIMLTSMNEQIDVITGRAFGAVEYITKPFDPEKLHEAIKKLL
ncbi:MAG: hypothetical protein COV46_08425 [Deltaproteobacteria bacterium CG11_big_fil_rev_8_21_14_0_20_49_13]|nr:MAG: hypothetical protein COV46_08425 [Deltaproteobacteria bacterium CG11_big_fil_rev_8_21_14_0_20_49_13]